MSSSSSVHAPHTPCSQAEMGAGQIETVAQKISEMGARLNGGLDGARVHGERDHGHVEASNDRAAQHREMNVPVGPRPRCPPSSGSRRATRASNCRGKSPVTRPPKAPRRRQPRSEVASTAPMTARAVADSGSISTTAIAWANSPGLRGRL